MKKVLKDKKAVITIGAILVLVIVIIMTAVMCGKNENKESSGNTIEKEITELEQKDSDKENSKEESKEESGRGLDVAGPDEADEDDRTGAVEFIGPDASGSGSEAGSENTTGSGNSGNSGSTTGNGNTSDGSTTDGEKEGNLDEEADSVGGYGDFF